MKIEIAHDLLAKCIYEMASAHDKSRAKAENLVRLRYLYFLTDSNLFLPKNDLAFIYPFLSEMNLSKEEQDFVEASYKQIKKLKFREKLRNYSLIGVSTAFVVGLFAVMGWMKAIQAENQYQVANKEKVQSQQELDSLNNQFAQLRKAVAIGDSSAAPIVKKWDDLQSTSISDIRNADITYALVEFVGNIQSSMAKPLEGAKISFMKATIETDAKGDFRLFVVLPPILANKEGLELVLEKEGYESKILNVKTKGRMSINEQLSPKNTQNSGLQK